MDKESIALITANTISRKKNKILSQAEVNSIFQHVSNIVDSYGINTISLAALPDRIIQLMYDDDVNRYEADYDIKQIQKTEMQIGSDDTAMRDRELISKFAALTSFSAEIQSIFGHVNARSLVYRLNPSIKFKYKTLVLDSLQQSISTRGTGKLSWELNYSGISIPNTIQITEPLSNIVGLRLGPSRWQFIDSYKYSSDLIARWTILIEEFASQSFIGPNGKKFHFMLGIWKQSVSDTIFSGNYYYDLSTHGFNQGYYWFNRPFDFVNNLTLEFGSPFQKFNMKSHTTWGTQSVTSNYLSVSFADSLVDASGSPLLGNEALTISGFTTSNPTNPADAALIASVNSGTHIPRFLPMAAPVSTRFVLVFNIDVTGFTIPSREIAITTPRYRSLYPLELIYLG